MSWLAWHNVMSTSWAISMSRPRLHLHPGVYIFPLNDLKLKKIKGWIRNIGWKCSPPCNLSHLGKKYYSKGRGGDMHFKFNIGPCLQISTREWINGTPLLFFLMLLFLQVLIHLLPALLHRMVIYKYSYYKLSLANFVVRH